MTRVKRVAYIQLTFEEEHAAPDEDGLDDPCGADGLFKADGLGKYLGLLAKNLDTPWIDNAEFQVLMLTNQDTAS